MMQNILPPPTLQGDERAQLTQVYRYLFRLSEQLNVSLSALEGRTATMARPSGGARSPEGTDAEQFWADADAQYSSLKCLIIKTANLVRAEMDQIVTNLGSEYVAVSEWGAYKEEVSREIVDTAKYTLENFEYNEEILNIPEMAAIFDSYRIETTGYIKRGIIGFDDENYPILGIAIGQAVCDAPPDGDVLVGINVPGEGDDQAQARGIRRVLVRGVHRRRAAIDQLPVHPEVHIREVRVQAEHASALHIAPSAALQVTAHEAAHVLDLRLTLPVHRPVLGDRLIGNDELAQALQQLAPAHALVLPALGFSARAGGDVEYAVCDGVRHTSHLLNPSYKMALRSRPRSGTYQAPAPN